jgi:hypothetical protein
MHHTAAIYMPTLCMPNLICRSSAANHVEGVHLGCAFLRLYSLMPHSSMVSPEYSLCVPPAQQQQPPTSFFFALGSCAWRLQS